MDGWIDTPSMTFDVTYFEDCAAFGWMIWNGWWMDFSLIKKKKKYAVVFFGCFFFSFFIFLRGSNGPQKGRARG